MKKIKSLLSILVVAMMIMSMLPFNNLYVYADDVSQYITGLEVTPASVETNGKVKVNVTFSDGSPDEQVIHSGDTIQISWPSSGEAFLKGYKTSIPLISSDGVTYGNVEVTSSGAVINFTDAVDEMFDVNGSFYFEVLAKNTTDTTEEDTKTVTITAGNKTADVSITKPASGSSGPGELPDFRKQAADIGGGWTHIEGIEGWVMTLNPDDPTYTSWILSANEKKDAVSSDIKVIDRLGTGQEVDTSWAHLYSGGNYNKNYTGTLQEVENAFKSDFPDSSLEFDESGNIMWIIDKTAANQESWYLEYRCDITDFSQLTFQNEADIYWTGEDGKTYSAHSDSQFANVDQGGDVSVLPRGVLQIIKKVSGTDYRVQGVRFVLEKQNGDTWEKVCELETDNTGMATRSKLRTGKYRLYEISAPEYLEMKYTESNPYEFEIDTAVIEKQSLSLTVDNDVVKEEITAYKKWENADGSDDVSEHPTIYFRLMRKVGDGTAKPYGEIKALDNGVLSVSWGNLPKYDIRGNKYEYSVKEVDENGNDANVVGYEKTEEGLSVVNIKEPTIKLEGHKTWNDDNDQDGIRPESIIVHLLADGEVIDECNVSETENWSWCFDSLPKHGTNGTEIKYTVKEDPVEGYEAKYDGGNITNIHTPETITVNGSKTWADNDDQDGIRPKSITVDLYADGVYKESVEVFPDDEGNWKYSFTNLPKYRDHGVEIKYSISEKSVTGYTAEIEGNDIKNVHIPETVEVHVKKEWNDDNDQDGIRPERITVSLIADGKETGQTVQLSDDNNWTSDFTSLDKYIDGKEIQYSVKEDEVKGYVCTVSTENKYDFTITNTHETSVKKKVIPRTGDSTGLKIWIVLFTVSVALATLVLKKRQR